jgi:hypothetical protein
MPANFETRTLRVITTGLLIDILAFTMILPLFPRLLDFYSKTPSQVQFPLEPEFFSTGANAFLDSHHFFLRHSILYVASEWLSE